MSSRLKDDGRSRAMARFKNKRMEKSKPESERDSGFSDGGSEHLSAVDQTDTDDASSSSRSQLTLQSLSPMIFMNNVVLKQSGENPSSLKPWAFSPAVEGVSQPQVVFLQPVVPQRSAPVLKGPPSKHHQHRKYLPILKSYPRIAPHPGDVRPKSSGGGSSSSSSRGQKDSLPSALTAERRPQSTDGSLRMLASDALSVDTDNKIKRFCNTYNILSKSGLLDITLRTKELIRQNRRTQTELDRLREHTSLFMEALRTGDSATWSKLRTSVQEEDKEKDRTVNLK
ncbi:CLOCK-interacting pacemaker-like isoform X2 [Sinocyclocheilus anshuiensis]|uniref:CLOCK-interacting pacemaker-like n=2 Tax=Sinocyclocheilus anshuiensis TaxID=1608454 RepID=A0A671MIU7_9TELE|nr:PREDICTED: CLOCK-interacting pacemaker-like isoform X2 [Sinocyclocheilus anshuiensis]XP_016304332.1 PREDICTED: CLOCK-interacting pacemaker-like isoform X2 [Sinocyclocheilus anshuiensis]XP_016304333.1 PREDICTED: CLOCK-interacting pacemaker-like isoform X2 [Sinocyclocheilus anshuiensis]XP_016304334.1 PREDICTED: CLOCK-interacting pacemaker-like isoform X2 [Sinocyclocheilus anshuiensis]